jgi:nanoRNase/pAp phosphatase (c-di-AMP/oligoRNAs hydrolase)
MPVTLRGDGSLNAVDGLAVNANAVFTSELGGRLANQCGTFGLVWQLGQNGQVKASLRGCGKLNLGQLAGQYGGGGHPNAAGFVMPMAEFFTQVLEG